MIPRSRALDRIESTFRVHPVAALLGPRQCGKTTLARLFADRNEPSFTVDEVGTEHLDRLWLRGGFPRSFLAADEEDSFAWRDAFVRGRLDLEPARIPAAEVS